MIQAVEFPIRMEQYLMVGAFNQVLSAKSQMPNPAFAFFMKSVMETVRESIAECAAVAYGSLTLASAQQLLMLDTREDLLAFIGEAHSDWIVNGDVITFEAPSGARSDDVPSLRLISESLNYATELERIV